MHALSPRCRNYSKTVVFNLEKEIALLKAWPNTTNNSVHCAGHAARSNYDSHVTVQQTIKISLFFFFCGREPLIVSSPAAQPTYGLWGVFDKPLGGWPGGIGTKKVVAWWGIFVCCSVRFLLIGLLVKKITNPPIQWDYP